MHFYILLQTQANVPPAPLSYILFPHIRAITPILPNNPTPPPISLLQRNILSYSIHLQAYMPLAPIVSVTYRIYLQY